MNFAGYVLSDLLLLALGTAFGYVICTYRQGAKRAVERARREDQDRERRLRRYEQWRQEDEAALKEESWLS